jgi:hypothetical protein
MGGLIGFILGYYVGAKDGPERLEELREALVSISESSDFQALRMSPTMMIQQTLNQVQSNLGANGSDKPLSTSEAWKTISESEEFKGLMATGAVVLQNVLSSALPQAPSNGHAGTPRAN